MEPVPTTLRLIGMARTIRQGRVFAVLTAAALLTGCGQGVARPGDPIDSIGSSVPADSPLVTADGDVLVSCAGGPAFPTSAMNGGVRGLAEEADIEAALDDLAAEAGLDAPGELQESSAADAKWMVLGRAVLGSTESLMLAIGEWDPARGPVGGGHVVLERVEDGWLATSWGAGCTLAPVLAEGLAWVEISADLDVAQREASTIEVQVSERDCASGRDPEPFLNDPVVEEGEDSVSVYWTSDSVEGGASCQGNPRVTRTVDLDEPLGDRVLLDGSTWPPAPVRTMG